MRSSADAAVFAAVLGLAACAPEPEPEPELDCDERREVEAAVRAVDADDVALAGDELVFFDGGERSRVYLQVELGEAAASSAERCWWATARLFLISSEGEPTTVYSTLPPGPQFELASDEGGAATLELSFPIPTGELAAALATRSAYVELSLVPDEGPPIRADLYSPSPALASDGAPPQSSTQGDCVVWSEAASVELHDPDEDLALGFGTPAELDYGAQGAIMFTPRLVVDNPEQLGEVCVFVDAVASLAGSDQLLAQIQGRSHTLTRGADGRLYSDPLFMPIWELPIDEALANGAEVDVVSWVGSRRVRTRRFVALVDEE